MSGDRREMREQIIVGQALGGGGLCGGDVLGAWGKAECVVGCEVCVVYSICCVCCGVFCSLCYK